MVIGGGPIGDGPIGGFPFQFGEQVLGDRVLALQIAGLIIPEEKVFEGILVRSYSALWCEIARTLGADWSKANTLKPEQWEEMVAGAFHKEGYDVVLTPRSGDIGRDIIASRSGIGSVRILGSVKAYKPGHLVKHEAVRSLLGVVTADQKASKGILTTTSDFAPGIVKDELIAPHLPTRIELINGARLQQWLAKLATE